jgi:hypothetical protein
LFSLCAARKGGAAKYRAIGYRNALAGLNEKAKGGGEQATARTSKIAVRALVERVLDRQRHRAHVLDLICRRQKRRPVRGADPGPRVPMLVINIGAACALADCRIESGANHKPVLYRGRRSRLARETSKNDQKAVTTEHLSRFFKQFREFPRTVHHRFMATIHFHGFPVSVRLQPFQRGIERMRAKSRSADIGFPGDAFTPAR